MTDRPPISGSDIDHWLADVPPEFRWLALIRAGVDAELWQQWQSGGGRERARPRWAGELIRWHLDYGRLRRRVAPFRTGRSLRPALSTVAAEIHAEEEADEGHYLRLAVEGDVVPFDIASRLLKASAVDSVVMPATRAPAALRRRLWRWPLRIGLANVDAGAVAAAVLRQRGSPPAEFVDLRNTELEPAAVDVLIVDAPLPEAVSLVSASRQIANAIIVLDPARATWPVVDGQLALLRAITAAVVTVLASPPGKDRVTGLASAVGELVRLMSVGQPFDTAVTSAFGRDVLIVGEIDSLDENTHLPAIVRGAAVDLRQEMRMRARDSGVRYRSNVRDVLGRSLGSPRGEDFIRGVLPEFSTPPIEARRREAINSLPPAPPRFLQCTVGLPSGNNVITHGLNNVQVFIGPGEDDALKAGEVTDRQLGLDSAQVDRVRVGVVLVPLIPRGDPVRTEIEVPRAGRSSVGSLTWRVSGKRASARILVMFGNRVLQTAILSGNVGRSAKLRELALLRTDFADLDDRRRFDAAIVKNHDEDGNEALIIDVDGEVLVPRLADLRPITDGMGTLLVDAADAKHGSRAWLDVLIDLAVRGSDYWQALLLIKPELANAHRVQVLTIDAPRSFPLELAYTRTPPDPGAVLCPNWEAKKECGLQCGDGADDTKIVCPAAFWGLHRIIERHFTPHTGKPGPVHVQVANPKAKDRRLAIDRALVAASSTVSSTARDKTVKLFASGTEKAESWREWRTQLASEPTRNLLVLMAHNAAGPALEISGDLLERGRLLPTYVVGPGADLHPLVLLFGCDTAGLAEDPSGWAPRFLQHRAAVVFSTLTMLYASQSATLAQTMARLLREPDRGEVSVGELSRTFRIAAVREGMISALGIAAYGDSDWTV